MQRSILGFTEKTISTDIVCNDDMFLMLNELSDDYLLNFDEIHQGWLYRSYTNKTTGRIVVKSLLDASKSIFTFPDERLRVKNVTCGWNKIYVIADDGSCWFGCLDSPDKKLQKIHTNTIAAKCIDVGDLQTLLLSEDGYVYDVICRDGSATGTIEPVKTQVPVPIQSIACGKEHALLLSIHGTVLSYGLGSRGQLGHGNVVAVKEPKVIEALDGIKIKHISAGGFHSAALTEDGDAYIWGWNESCQLGYPNKHTPGIAGDEVLTFQVLPKLLDFSDNIIDISCGSRHTAAVTGDRKFWSWGWNAYGQLGLQGEFSSKPTIVPLPKNVESPFQVKCKHWTTVLYSRNPS